MFKTYILECGCLSRGFFFFFSFEKNLWGIIFSSKQSIFFSLKCLGIKQINCYYMSPISFYNHRQQQHGADISESIRKYSEVLGLTSLQQSLVGVSIPAQTSWPRSKLGRRGFIWLTLPCCCSSPKKSGLELKQVRKQELMQRQWRDVLYWLASPGLHSLLSYRTKTTSPEMVPPTRGLSPLFTNWENALQLYLMEAFPQLRFLSLWWLLHNYITIDNCFRVKENPSYNTLKNKNINS